MDGAETLELRRWADRVEALIAGGGLGHVKRVIVFAETGSTQDAAELVSAGESGVVVLAGRQTAGRGRLGRVWVQRGAAGVAATFTLALARELHGALALAAGVAAAEAVERCLPFAAAGSAARSMGLRWPNDVVERASGRKVAGVLVESRALARDGRPLLLVGIGVNVAQDEDDFPPDIRERAVSVRGLGGDGDRTGVVLRLIERFDHAVGAVSDDAGRSALLEQWKRRDVLRGRPAVFEHDGAHYEGIVMEVRPDLSLILRTGGGELVELPGASTTLLGVGSSRGRGGGRGPRR